MTNAQEQRRLLELAAKALNAAGGRIQVIQGKHFEAYDHGSADGISSPEWNPADDDGDSRRLAVKLKFSTHVFDLYVLVETGFDDGGFREASDDLNAALRLAVLRAAAAMGEKMEEEE